MTNNKIVLASITVIVAAGLLVLNPSMIGNAQGQLYANDYGYNNNYYQDDNNRYSYDEKDSKSSHTDIQKIKCVNSNINVNGIDITKIPKDDTATAATNEGATDVTGAQNGNGWADKINFNKNLVNICVNVNVNEQVKTSTPEEPEPTCEDCFADLTDAQITGLLEAVQATSIGAYCDRLLDTPNTCEERADVSNALNGVVPIISNDQIDEILQCLVDTGVIISPTEC